MTMNFREAKTNAPAAKTAELPRALRKLGGIRKLDLREYNPAVYFLVRNGEVVYVGQSVNPRARISAHITEREKDFDSAFLRHCDAQELNTLESYFIHMLAPEYNCTLPDGTKLAPENIGVCIEIGERLRKTNRQGRQDRNAIAIKDNGKFTMPPRPASNQPTLERVPSAAKRMGLSVCSVYREIKAGRLGPLVKIGVRASALPTESIDMWISQRIGMTAAPQYADQP